MEHKEEEPLDPRVQIELERLNASSEDINKLENKLEEANTLFRSTLSDSTANLKLLSRRLGAAVEKARPYYEAREVTRRTQLDCHKAAVQFQRASVLHQNARETIQLAEERFLPQRNRDTAAQQPQQFEFDNAWQEMLNHATMKLLEAEQLKHSSETEHLRRANTFSEAQKKLKRLERSLERHIGRARPYFEQREVVQQELVRQKAAIQQLQRAVTSAKARYSSSLRELENISEQIHEQRRLRELEPDLVPIDLDTCDLGSVSAVTESATSDYEEDFKLSQEQQYWTEMREQIEAMSANLAGGRGAASEPAAPTSPQLEVPAPAFPAAPAREPEQEPEQEPPLAEELSAARLIARRRTVSEAAGGDRRLAPAERRLSLAPAERRLSLAPAERRLSLAPAERRLSLAPAGLTGQDGAATGAGPGAQTAAEEGAPTAADPETGEGVGAPADLLQDEFEDVPIESEEEEEEAGGDPQAEHDVTSEPDQGDRLAERGAGQAGETL